MLKMRSIFEFRVLFAFAVGVMTIVFVTPTDSMNNSPHGFSKRQLDATNSALDELDESNFQVGNPYGQRSRRDAGLENVSSISFQIQNHWETILGSCSEEQIITTVGCLADLAIQHKSSYAGHALSSDLGNLPVQLTVRASSSPYIDTNNLYTHFFDVAINTIPELAQIELTHPTRAGRNVDLYLPSKHYEPFVRKLLSRFNQIGLRPDGHRPILGLPLKLDDQFASLTTATSGSDLMMQMINKLAPLITDSSSRSMTTEARVENTDTRLPQQAMMRVVGPTGLISVPASQLPQYLADSQDPDEMLRQAEAAALQARILEENSKKTSPFKWMNPFSK